MTFPDLFSEKSERYAAARPRYPEELFAFIAAQVHDMDRAWDCGTGSGQAAVALAEHFSAVDASDPSPQQIANASPHGRVTYSIQTAESTNYPDSSFDAVCVAQALHWFNLGPFFQEAKRVAKPGGVFAAWGYAWFHVSPSFDEAFRRTILDVIKDDWAPQNAILWNGYREVEIPFLEIATPQLNILANWNFFHLLAYIHTWSSVRRCMARIGDDFFSAAEAALMVHWGEPSVVREIIMPLHFRAGIFNSTYSPFVE